MKLCSEAQWDSLARTDETATFFQTPAWHKIAARLLGAECAPLLFDFPAAQGGPACLPLLRDRRWGRDRYFSPFGTYTAVTTPRILQPSETAVIETTLRGLNLALAGSPYTQNPVSVGKVVASSIQVIDLTDLDPENPMRDWSSDPRRKLRIAQRGSVRIRIAETESDWEAYYEVYEKSLKRWGRRASSMYPESLFEMLRGLPAESMKLWLAEHDGRVIAGFVAFYHNRHACIWHGASDPEFFRLGGVQLLYHDLIAYATRAGYPVFDVLGNGGNTSLEPFKASLGARRCVYDSCLNRTGLVGALAGLRDKVRNA